jgi:hypothetical protein
MFTLPSELGHACSNGDWPARLDLNGHVQVVIMPVQSHYSLIANVKEKETGECDITNARDTASSNGWTDARDLVSSACHCCVLAGS